VLNSVRKSASLTAWRFPGSGSATSLGMLVHAHRAGS
jgi:hypothetical protein